MKVLYARLLVLAAALLAVLPLMAHGTSCGHDYPFHVTNWMEAQRQWMTGVAMPRWSFRAAWGAGEPRFLFYPPLSWMLGALLGSVLPWTAVPIAFTWVALVLSGLSMFALARRYVRVEVAIASAVLYLANPYMLFTGYERTAYGELLAAAWMPWLLREALRHNVKTWRLAIPIALLWLSNAPAGVIGGYTLLLIAVIRFVALFASKGSERSATVRTLLVQGVGGVVLGLTLAAFYLVPAILERPLVEVQMAVIEGMRPWDNFLFHRGPDIFRNAVIHTASVTALAVLIPGIVFAIAALLFNAFIRRVSEAPVAAAQRSNVTRAERDAVPSATPLALLLVLAFLVTPASTFVWKYAPQLLFLQFPWRVVSIAAAIAAFAFALIFSKVTRVAVACAGLAVACILSTVSVLSASKHFRQYCSQNDRVTALKASVDAGEGDWPTDEYTPQPADNDMLARDNPPYWIASNAGATAVHQGVAGVIAVSTGSPYHTLYFVPANRGEFLVLNHRWFKGWHLRVNGAETQPATMRADGLTSIALPPNRDNEIDLAYHWATDQWLGLALSLAALGALLMLRRRETRRPAAQVK